MGYTRKIAYEYANKTCAYIKEISQISQQTIEYMSKEIIGYKTEEKDLNIVDVMKELKCTRYMVMKY